MKKIIVVAVILALAIPFLIMPAFKAASKAEKSAVDVGNKICPVSDEAVSGKHFAEYQGKRYGLCCPMCEAKFLSDPAKYITQMEAKEKASASTAAAPADPASKKMEMDMEQGDL